MISDLRKIFVITIGILLSSTNVLGQYHSKTIDISKTITSLITTEEGFLRYGSKTGEIGLFDGLVLDKKESFQGEINRIKVTDTGILVLTSKGLYQKKDEKFVLISPNTLNILDVSQDLSILITTSGIYNKSGSDYLPDSEVFYNINEIGRGGIFNINDQQYLWLDRKIYINDNSWKEIILHPQANMDVTSLSNKLIISDYKGLVSFYGNEQIDTLYRSDSVATSKVFPIDNNTLLYCMDNKVNIFDIRNEKLTYIREAKTELINTVVVDTWNNIWIAAGSYLYQVSEIKKRKDNLSPILKIKNVKVNGLSKEWDKSITLDKENNDIEISYSGVHLSKPQDLIYQSKLTTNNITRVKDINSWVSRGKKVEAEYRDLPAGRYKFQVRATVDGEYYTYGKTIDIRVNDNTVQYYWLAGLLAAAFFFLMAIFFNSRYNRLKSNSDKERKLLIQENKMLSLQQKALQLQMNPHFVFNALNSIQGLIAKEDNKRARRYLQQFSSMMRSVLNQSRKESISLEEEIAYLKSYLSLEQMANNDNFDFEINVDDAVEEDVNIPTMIIQPFIENAIIHGVKGLKERRGKISVSFVQENTLIKCIVVDNGIGRTASSQTRHKTHKSIALDVVQDRLKNKGSRRNPVVFTDLKNESGGATGTQVDVVMPIV